PLHRLLRLAGDNEVPIVLSVSPFLIEDAFAERLSQLNEVYLAAHGFRHANHAKGSRKAEFGADRSFDIMREEIEQSADRFGLLFPTRGLALFVPPWHGFDLRLIADLLRVGVRALSLFEPRLIRAGEIFAAKLPSINFPVRLRKIQSPILQNGILRWDCSINLLAYGSNREPT